MIFFLILRGTKLAQFGVHVKRESIQGDSRKYGYLCKGEHPAITAKKGFFCSSYIKYWYWFIPLTLITH